MLGRRRGSWQWRDGSWSSHKRAVAFVNELLIDRDIDGVLLARQFLTIACGGCVFDYASGT